MFEFILVEDMSKVRGSVVSSRLIVLTFWLWCRSNYVIGLQEGAFDEVLGDVKGVVHVVSIAMLVRSISNSCFVPAFTVHQTHYFLLRVGWAHVSGQGLGHSHHKSEQCKESCGKYSCVRVCSRPTPSLPCYGLIFSV